MSAARSSAQVSRTFCVVCANAACGETMKTLPPMPPAQLRMLQDAELTCPHCGVTSRPKIATTELS